MTEPPDVIAPEAEPPLDRAISPISGRLGGGRPGKVLAFAGLLAGCGVFAFASWSADRPKPERSPERPARQVVAFEAAPPTLTRSGPDAATFGDRDGFVPAIDPAAVDDGPPPRAVPAAAAGSPRVAPLMAYSRSAARLDLETAAPIGIRTAGAASGEATGLDQLRRGSRLGQATARRLGDRNFLILAGATIPCVLQTALDSATSGYVTCLIGSDVYSDNGAVVLLDKGTRVLGEYRSGLRQGQRRIFVLWIRAVTPNGVAIDLASPAADALGRGGFDGRVDTHFWDRFGAALLLSVVDDGAAAIAEDDRDRATTRLPSDAAALAVQGAADIAPTLRKPQGSEVSILAAQDFDFASVYGLKSRAP